MVPQITSTQILDFLWGKYDNNYIGVEFASKKNAVFNLVPHSKLLVIYILSNKSIEPKFGDISKFFLSCNSLWFGRLRFLS